MGASSEAAPSSVTVGRTAFLEQRAMQQWCTGVISTPQATWLVGRMESTLPEMTQETPLVAKVPNLAKLVPLQKDQYSSERPTLSFISRLNAKGEFELLATVPEVACLYTNAAGNRVYLLTGLELEDVNDTRRQTAVLRSDDQGKTWQWMKNGFMPGAEWLAWSLKPVFTRDGEVWAVGLDEFNFDSVMGDETNSRLNVH